MWMFPETRRAWKRLKMAVRRWLTISFVSWAGLVVPDEDIETRIALKRVFDSMFVDWP